MAKQSDLKTKEKWHGACTACNNSWYEDTKPTKCPNCGNVGIIVDKGSAKAKSIIDSERCKAICQTSCGIPPKTCGKRCEYTKDHTISGFPCKEHQCENFHAW